MKYKLIIPLLAGAIFFGGCSKEKRTNQENNEKDLLTFGLDDVESRGISTSTATISEFGVYCFDTGQAKWDDVRLTALPNKMFNQQVLKTGDLWSYNPPVYWESYDNKLHSFFSYSPMAKGMLVDNVDGNNLKLLSDNSTAGVPTLSFEVIDDVSSQIDLLVAKTHFDLKPTNTVLMKFDHALTRVGFKAFSEVSGTYIEKIEIIDVPYKGTLRIVHPGLLDLEPDLKTFTLDYGGGLPILSTKDKPTDISAPGRYLMAVPYDWTGNITGKIRVSFRKDGKSSVSEFLIGSLNEIWKQNGSITYVLDLNGVPNSDLIVEKVIVEEWKMGNTTDTDLGLKGQNFWLRFDSNGGDTNKPADIELESGTLYKIPNTVPIKAGSTFKAWNTAQNGSGKDYIVGERVPIDLADVTLYAKW